MRVHSLPVMPLTSGQPAGRRGHRPIGQMADVPARSRGSRSNAGKARARAANSRGRCHNDSHNRQARLAAHTARGRMIRKAHDEQVFMSECFWRSGRAVRRPTTGPLSRVPSLDGCRLAGSYLPGPDQRPDAGERGRDCPATVRAARPAHVFASSISPPGPSWRRRLAVIKRQAGLTWQVSPGAGRCRVRQRTSAAGGCPRDRRERTLRTPPPPEWHPSPGEVAAARPRPHRPGIMPGGCGCPSSGGIHADESAQVLPRPTASSPHIDERRALGLGIQMVRRSPYEHDHPSRACASIWSASTAT